MRIATTQKPACGSSIRVVLSSAGSSSELSYEGELNLPLNPRLRVFLAQAGLLYPSGQPPREPHILLAEMRAADESARAVVARADEIAPIAHVEQLVISGPVRAIPARLYTPDRGGLLPALVFLHGGGLSGNLDTNEIICRRLCRVTGCKVLSVDFRLPPEHPFPAGLEDCYAATCWLDEHAPQFNMDSKRIAIGGDSGGGNLAAGVALMARDRGGPALAFQLLLWPLMDFEVSSQSWKDYDGVMMTSAEFLIFRDFYLPNPADQMHSYAAPLRAHELHGLPPTLILTAECDPLRDGGEGYAQRLREAGVPVTLTRYDGMTHGFLHMGMVVPAEVEAGFAEIGRALRETL